MRVARRAKSRTVPTTEVHESAGKRARAAARPDERRLYTRNKVALPLSVRNIAGQLSARPVTVHTRNISSSGAYFLYPEWIEPGTPVAIEVALLVQRRRHRAVRMCTDAHVVRAQPVSKPGWHGLAVAFDDIRFVRGDYSLSHSGLSVTGASS